MKNAAVQPHIIGIRHHSPACARLVAQRIQALKPAYVLIEGPCDFNPRLDELALPHRLPIAIYSYLSSEEAHYGSWSPLAEHSPEWQALQAGRAVGAQVRFIDLPAWHQALFDVENRYADMLDAVSEQHAESYEQALADALFIEGRDALWDHLFEAESPSPLLLGASVCTTRVARPLTSGPSPARGKGSKRAREEDDLAQRLQSYFAHLRPAQDTGSAATAAREQMMACWMAWAVQQAGGQAERVLVVCGGWHAPALAHLWPQMPCALPAVPVPESSADKLHYGSYLVPYSFQRLDAFTGYAAGMPSPAWYQWVWEWGHAGAAERALEHLMRRLREKKLPVSTAELIAVHTRAHALARLRGHSLPLRCDWLDALAGSLVKSALDAPVPWSYRGPLLRGTAPELVEAMDVLAGDCIGQLAPQTPQPPLVASVQAELAALGIALPGVLQLKLYREDERAKSRILHRLLLLGIPGIVRRSGPKHPLADDMLESWQLSTPLEQTAALIEAAVWGANLHDAARAQLEHRLGQAQGRIHALTDALQHAAWAGLGQVSQRALHDLQAAITQEPRFEALAPALGLLHTLLRHGHALHMLEMQDAPLLHVILEAGFDRALWLLEPPAAIAPADIDAHLQGYIALRYITTDALATDSAALPIEPKRALAVWQRKAADNRAAPVSRGAALGALLHCADPGCCDSQAALQLLQRLPPFHLGDALVGLLALGREALATDSAFIVGMDQLVQTLDNADFVQALPAMRQAFAWLPPQERGTLAEQIVGLHQREGAAPLSARSLLHTFPAATSTEAWAKAEAAEAAALAALQVWGLGKDVENMHYNP